MLTLIRHAHAIDLAPDDARPLSEKGRLQVARLAAHFARTGCFEADELWHSPLVRAAETAQLLVRHAGLSVPVRVVEGLRPEDHPAGIARRLVASGKSIAVVGHEPHLGVLASLLITGGARPTVMMAKGAALALEGGGAYWQARWFLPPEVLG